MKFDYIYVATSVWSSGHAHRFLARACNERAGNMYEHPLEDLQVEKVRARIVRYLQKRPNCSATRLRLEKQLEDDGWIFHVSLEGLEDMGVLSARKSGFRHRRSISQ